MKKLKLKLEGINEMLTKEQMKRIHGGYNPDVCDDECETDADCANVQGCPYCKTVGISEQYCTNPSTVKNCMP